jgi:hypothetical protein
MTLRSVAHGLLALLLVGPRVIHEALHYLVARRYVPADRLEGSFSVTDANAVVRIDWPAATPAHAIALTHLAPTLVGFGAMFIAFYGAAVADAAVVTGPLGYAYAIGVLYVCWPQRTDLAYAWIALRSRRGSAGDGGVIAGE